MNSSKVWIGSTSLCFEQADEQAAEQAEKGSCEIVRLQGVESLLALKLGLALHSRALLNGHGHESML